ncbi:MAG: retroviral-like aspartic protease family protein [Leptospiraceae bacterium]|nr:retroviral-like aspartic protease family protein [Leptospiraceae bacterium]
MGKVTEKVKLINYGDLWNAKKGLISKEEIRWMEVEAIIDTGAVMSCLPKKIAEQLGLDIDEEDKVRLVYANGDRQFKPKAKVVSVVIQDRNWNGDCICEENSDHVIIGQIPLEQMDLVVDCNQQKVYPNPKYPDKTTLLML